jgi:hypothetical protein
MGVAVGSRTGVFVGAGMGVSVGPSVGVYVGAGVAVLGVSGVSVLVAVSVDVGGWIGDWAWLSEGVTDTVAVGRAARSTVSTVACVVATGARPANHMAMSKTLIVTVAMARTSMLATVTGHHCAGTSRFPRQTGQNISPAVMSF